MVLGISSFVPPSRRFILPAYANNTGDDTLYFPDWRGELSGSGCNGMHIPDI